MTWAQYPDNDEPPSKESLARGFGPRGWAEGRLNREIAELRTLSFLSFVRMKSRELHCQLSCEQLLNAEYKRVADILLKEPL
jgi:hypothetical protein